MTSLDRLPKVMKIKRGIRKEKGRLVNILCLILPYKYVGLTIKKVILV